MGDISQQNNKTGKMYPTEEVKISLSNTATTTFSLFILVLLSLAGYQHALSGSFVFDDIVAIVKNQDVTMLPTNLSAIFHHDFWGAPLTDMDSHKSFRPLTTLMFHAEFAHLQLRAKHMKILNLLLHCINTCLVWKLFGSLEFESTSIEISRGKVKQIATIAAALFAVHPVHTEAVCGVVGRTELMFCLCFLLALLLISARSDEVLTFIDIAIVFLALVGLLFKESAIMILPACIFVDYMRREKFLMSLRQKLTMLCSLRNVIYICFMLLLLIWRLWLQNFESPHFKPMDNPIAFSADMSTKFLSQNLLYVFYCWILLCPQWLSFDWALGSVTLVESVQDVRVLGILALYTFMLLLMWRHRHNPCLLLGLGLLVIPFVPASGLIKVGFVVAERVLYVPSIGFCFLMAYSFVKLRHSLKNRWILALQKWLLVLVFVCFLLRTRERATDWLTEEKLFSSALKVCPRNAKVHYNIARLASDKLERQKAFQHYHKAIALYPQYESALMNLGNLYREIGDFHTAEKYLKDALDALPEFPAAWMNLGIVQSARKKYTEALQSYEKALSYRKRYAICHYNMGNLFLDLKQYSEAMHHWQEAVALNPEQPKAWANILTMLDNRGLFEDAIRLSAKALEYLPYETTIMFIRANVLGKLQHYIEAESLYKRVIDVEPINILYHTNLGVLYHRWGKFNSAIDSYQQALKLNPEKAKTAHDNLSKLLRRRRQEKTRKKM